MNTRSFRSPLVCRSAASWRSRPAARWPGGAGPVPARSACQPAR